MESYFQVPEPATELIQRAEHTRAAALDLGQTSNEHRENALASIANSLMGHSQDIIQANLEDLKAAREEGLSPALLSRLKLDESKLREAINGVRKVAKLSDPLGIKQLHRELDSELVLERITVPLGVIGVIFEARPDAAIQIASLAIRSGNGALLKGGKEASLTNKEIISAIKRGLIDSSLAPESLELLTTRKESLALLKLEDYVDLIIPRGSNELVRFIQDNTRIPVLGHADGICHLYVDEDVNLEQAISIALDSKIQYPAACNSIETLLLHENIAASFLEKAIGRFEKAAVELYGDEVSRSFGVKLKAQDEDWSREYLDLKLSIRVVHSLEDALDHIQRYGSRHTEAIATNNQDVARRFLQVVDSSGVYHNCSTRFADGFRYGFGAEVGISTQTLPPRGPVGLEGLVTYKYLLKGNGHIAENYSSGNRSFSHKDLL
tara:strand:+ start:527 stop:1840 length:1314 start_codon:yes stop_codon:yes gene_type:complete